MTDKINKWHKKQTINATNVVISTDTGVFIMETKRTPNQGN